MDNITELFAKAYNILPSQLKIALMVSTSFLLSGIVNLLIKDLTNYNTDSEFLKLIVDSMIPVLTVIFNMIQQLGVESGTRALATKGDSATIDKLETKVTDTKEIIQLSK